MSSFIEFAYSFGLEIDRLVYGAVKRVRTTDKPKKKNGAYFFGGDWGWLQNWSQMDTTAIWRSERTKFLSEQERIDMEARILASKERDDRRRHEDALRAEQKAAAMIGQAILYPHPYLSSKGFPEAKGLVLDQTLLVRMEYNGNLVGLQTIEMVDGDWQKKMLFGMRAKGASLMLSRGTWPVLVEGYATGLSIQEVLKSTPMGAYVIVCFSAGNLVEVAKRFPNARVFADNDKSGAGQEAAEKSGRPWTMSPVQGEDANDLWRRDPMELAKLLVKLRSIR